MISFHLGIGVDGISCSSAASYLENLKLSEKLVSYGESIGFEFTTLDLGGGFAGHSYCIENVRELSVSINKALDEICRSHPTLNNIIAEPGMHIMIVTE